MGAAIEPFLKLINLEPLTIRSVSLVIMLRDVRLNQCADFQLSEEVGRL